MQDYVGQDIGRYHVIKRQGMGGMAVVYHAYDTRLDRDVALKLIRTDSLPPDMKEQLLKRFEREAKAQARFSHPNIVPVHDYGEVDGAPYLVMEYIPGGTLKELTGQPMPCAQALAWIIPIADALDYAHERGIIHRDIKPSNILITEKNRPMLTDFGIAKLLESQDKTQLTTTGLGVGTPEYMAPEQWHGKAFPQSDIYALGVVLYELLTGIKPYRADTPAAVAILQATEPLPSPTAFAPDLPEKVEKLLYKALARNPQDRYESMAAFQQALQDAAKESQTLVNRQAPVQNIALPDPGNDDETPTEIMAMPPVKTALPIQPPAEANRQSTAVMPAPARPKHKFPSWLLWGGAGLLLLIVVIAGIILLGKPNPNSTQALAPTRTKALTARPTITPRPSATTVNNEAAAAGDTLNIGLVTDVGVLEDKSFNQSAWEGLLKAADTLSAHVEFIETRDSADYAANIAVFTERGFDIIVTTGWGLTDATRAAAANYPDIKFIGIDQYQSEPLPNLAGLVFPEWKGGFQAGALAALLTESNLVAGIYGPDLVPAVVAFAEGYQDGAHYIDPAVEVITIYHPGDFSNGFTDPEWGGEIANQVIQQGADVVFAAGGETGSGALLKSATYQDVICIGVDTDQWETVPEARPCLVSSAMKQIDKAVFELILAAKENRFPSGNTFGMVGLAPFHDFDARIPQDIKETLQQIEDDLLNDRIRYEDFH